MTRGLYVPTHYVPNPSMTDEELLRIAGLTDMGNFRALQHHGIASDPRVGFYESLARPLPSLGEGFAPDIPIHPADQADLDARLPDIDFVPEGVVDPRERARMRARLRAREASQVQLWRRTNQFGGLAASLKPGQSAPVLQWYSETDAPQAVNVQLAFDIDSDAQFSATGAATDVVALYAKLEWGSGNAQNTAFVDFQNGTQVRLTGSFVRVTALYQPSMLPTGWPPQPDTLVQPPVGTPLTGPTVSASALLGMGFPTFRTSAARFTRSFLLANGASLLLDPIPAFASAFGFATTLAAGTSLTFTLRQGRTAAPNGNPSFTVATNPNPDNAFPIPQGCRLLNVTNGSGQAAGVALTYALML